MKKIFVLSGVLAIIGFSSCKKDWSCLCTNQNGSQTSYPINNQTLLNARDKCKDMNYTDATLGTSQTCALQ